MMPHPYNMELGRVMHDPWANLSCVVRLRLQDDNLYQKQSDLCQQNAKNFRS